MHTKKAKIHTKKCQNENVVPLEKRTVKTKSVVPLEKEQKIQVSFLWKRNNKNQKCRSFGKGTTKTQVLFLWKRNNKNEKCRCVILFENEQQNVKMQKYYSIRKGTAKSESAEVLFHSETNSKT